LRKFKKIPAFKSLADEQRFWEKHNATDYVDFSKADLGFFPELKPSSRTISIRLPDSLLEAIKLLANKQDVPYQSMLKILLSEKVREVMGLPSRKGRAA
jgi:predicted DNA binding CopG/RHH family protein